MRSSNKYYLLLAVRHSPRPIVVTRSLTQQRWLYTSCSLEEQICSHALNCDTIYIARQQSSIHENSK